MRSQKLIFLFSFIIFSLSFASEVFAYTIIDADISEDTTWTQNQNPYVVNASINILPGAILTIEPGVVVKFNYGVSLNVDGSINALGTETEPIYFTSYYDDEFYGGVDDEEFCYEDTDEFGNILGEICGSYDFGDPFSGDWNGIYFFNSVNSNLENVFLRYAQDPLTFNESNGRLENLNIDQSDAGLTVFNNSHIELSGGVFNNLQKEALVLFNDSSFVGDNMTISNLSPDFNDAIVLFNNSDFSIKNSSFENCPDNACITFFDGRDAFYMTNPSSINIENTIFDGGLGSGLLTFGDSEIVANIKNSSFSNFDYYAIENYADFSINAKNNFWGDASGPYDEILNGTGLGEIIYGNVDFTPWLSVYPPLIGCITDCFSNVLFLPGLEASRLYEKRSDESEDQLWEPNANSDVEALYLNTDGTSKNSNIYTRDIIKETNTPIPTGPVGLNIYKSFANTMDELLADGKINGWKDYAYDWRQDVNDIVNNGTQYESGNLSLTDTLQFLVDTSKNEKVTIVAHSNGGLVAKAFLKKLQDDKDAGVNDLIDKVDVLILVAVPEIGTASAVPAMLHGYEQRLGFGLLMDEVHARELGRNMLGAYGLLPSREYINHVSASPATFVDTAIPSNVTTKMVQKFGSAINSYDEYKGFLFGNEGRVNPATNQINLPINLSESLFSNAEDLHNSIDAWIPPENLRVIEVAGWGLDTIASFEYYPKCVSLTTLVCNFILDERPRFTFNGDKTVVIPSAHYSGFLGNAEKYWVDLKYSNDSKPPFTIQDNHANILEVESLNNFIKSVVNKNDITFDNVLKNSEPVDTENRFRISIHSPVTLDAYDNDGNHTGKVCPLNFDFCHIEENIPNSLYMEFGEGKYLNLPENKMKSIKLQGTDVGTFTYESEKVLPDGTSATSSFVDIPVTTQTQGEVNLNQFGAPQMKLDVTGDGVIDFTLGPSAEFDPIVYLQIMKSTINSLELTKAQKNAFNNRVDNIIKSIQKGKINKAKLKADKFKNALERKLAKPDPKKPRPKKISKTDAQMLLDMLNKLLDNLS